MNNRGKGVDGEVAVMEYLMKRGYLLLECNYKEKCGEIDIISQKDGVLVFTEVKNRTSDGFGTPLDAVTPQKISRIVKTAEMYLSRKKRFYNDCRFDVAIVRFGEVEEYLENAFTKNDRGRKNHW